MRAFCLIAGWGVVAACGCGPGTPLFNGKDLTGWVEVGSDGAWSVQDGLVKCSGQKHAYAWLSTDRTYGDLELTLEWRISPGGNSGVFLRAPDREGRTSMRGLEVQISDDDADEDDPMEISGAIFRRIPPAGRFSKPVGEWNHFRITLRGRRLRVALNGHLTCEADIDTVAPRGDDPPMRAVPNEGYIGLQNHGNPVEFRNIRIREL